MLVGAAIVASRFVLAEVPPLTLAMLRYAIGVLCIAPFVGAAWRQHRLLAPAQQVPARDLMAMAALGIGQFAVLIALLNWGLKHVNAAPAALIFSLFPLLTLMLGATTGRERISPRLLAGVVISICGVALSMAPKLAASHAGHWWGELAVFASALVGAACSILYRPYLQRYPTVPVSAYAMAASAVFLTVPALLEAWPQRVLLLGPGAWAVVAFVGVASGVGYVWWLYALKHESPTRVTVFLALNPVTAAILGWLLLGEALHPAGLAGLGLIFAGLWLATRPPAALTGSRQQALR